MLGSSLNILRHPDASLIAVQWNKKKYKIEKNMFYKMINVSDKTVYIEHVE